jgi:hypothetical protein
MALLDMAARGRDLGSAVAAGAESTTLTTENVRRYVTGLGNRRVQRMVLTAVEVARGDIDRARGELEAWFDSAMDRVSGRYRRRTAWVLFAVGLSMTVLLNVDAVRIATALYKSPALREAAVAMAGRVTGPQEGERAEPVRPQGAAVGEQQRNQPATQSSTGRIDANAALDSLYVLRLPIGWGDTVAGPWPTAAEWEKVGEHIWDSLFGWLLTAFAISLGAPFWFDTLNRIMVIRSTVKPREKSPDEASEDRQAKVVSSNRTSPSAGSDGGRTTASTVIVTTGGGADAGFAVREVAHEWAVGDPQGGIL